MSLGRRRLPAWLRRPTVAAALLALAPVAFHWRLLVPGPARKWLEDGDFVDQFFAFAAFETAELAAGRVPLWNPHAYAGSPFWADVQAAVAYPPSLAVVLAAAGLHDRLPFAWLQLEAVAHLSLGALLLFALARRLIGGTFGPAVAALCWSLGGYLTGYPVLQLAVLESVIWFPLALLGADAALAGRRTWPLLPLALGLIVLAGHPQTALHAGYAVAAFVLWRAWPLGTGSAARRERLVRAAPRLAASAALGVALSAAGWWPALEFLARSNRASAGYEALAHGFPPRELLGLVLAGPTKWAPLYAGLLPLALAIWAAGRAVMGGVDRSSGDHALHETDRTYRTHRTYGSHETHEAHGSPQPTPPPPALRDDRFWLALVLTALLLSLGGDGPLFGLAYLAAPGWDLFRGQERAAALVALGISMLAGRGAAVWAGGGAGAASVDRHVSRFAAAIAVAGGALAVVAAPGLDRALVRLALVAGVAALLAATRARATRAGRHAAWGAAVLLAVALDLYGANAGANLAPHPPAELAGGPITAVLAMAPDRVADDRLPPNAGMLHGYAATGGASPLRLRTLDALRDALAGDEARLWDLLGVGHVVSWRREVPGASRLLDEGEGDTYAALHVRDAPRPPAWRVGQVERAASDADALARLADPAFDPFATVLLHEGEAPQSPGRSAGSVQVARRAPGELMLQTDGALPGWVVASEMAYPAWRATVDGKPAPVLRAHVALVAVPVPAGAHEVRLYVAADRVLQGLSVSLAAALALAGLAGRGVVGGHSLGWPTRRGP